MQEQQFQLKPIEANVFTQEGTNMEEQRMAIRVDVEHLTEAVTSAALRAVANQPDSNQKWGSMVIRFGGRLDLVALQAIPQTGPALSVQEP